MKGERKSGDNCFWGENSQLIQIKEPQKIQKPLFEQLIQENYDINPNSEENKSPFKTQEGQLAYLQKKNMQIHLKKRNQKNHEQTSNTPSKQNFHLHKDSFFQQKIEQIVEQGASQEEDLIIDDSDEQKSDSYDPEGEMKTRKDIKNMKNGEKCRNFLPTLKTLILKHFAKIEKSIEVEKSLEEFKSKKTANLQDYQRLFEQEALRQILGQMFFTERFLKREIQISRIASELKPFYLKKLKVLEDGLKNKKITRLN